MRKSKKVTKTVVEYVTSDIFCDWCGEAICKDGKYTKRGLGYSITNDEHFECTFYRTKGEGTHMAGYGWEIDDMCRPCVDKFQALLEENGIKLSKVDW